MPKSKMAQRFPLVLEFKDYFWRQCPHCKQGARVYIYTGRRKESFEFIRKRSWQCPSCEDIEFSVNGKEF